MSNLNRKQFEQPAMFDTHSMKEPEFNDPHWNNWFENSIRAERALAGGTGKVLDAQEPEYRKGIKRPGGGAMPGQYVMGEKDLSHTERKFSTKVNPYTGKSEDVTMPLMVEGHGTVHDAETPHTIYRAWGPQFGHNGSTWDEHAEHHMMRADSPVASAQPMLRYDPATGGKWQRSIGRPEFNQTHTDRYHHNEYNHGIQGDLDFSDPSSRPAILRHGGTHYVVDGHHRLYEARSRGMERIPVRVLDADKLMRQHGYDEQGRSPVQQRIAASQESPTVSSLLDMLGPRDRGAFS